MRLPTNDVMATSIPTILRSMLSMYSGVESVIFQGRE
ncbi:Uncharacterised protein [Bordetella pertussis]|nr:Uncharacterised protein [Bordetella pertussis]